MTKRKKPGVRIFDGIWQADFSQKKRIFTGGGRFLGAGYDFLDKVSQNRIRVFELLIISVVIVFLVRLFLLSVVHGGENLELAENNRIRLVFEEPMRGRIMSADGEVLAQSVTKYFLEKDGLRHEITEEQVKELEKAGLAGEDFVGELGGVDREIVRNYPSGEMSSHITGYTSLVQKEDIAKNAKLKGNDFVGRLGIEEAYDELLRGEAGKKIVEVDSKGKTISILGQTTGTGGADILLSIDSALQKKAYEVLASHLAKLNLGVGALVITEPFSGQILALVSMPSYDPADVGKSVASERKPLFNRVISGTYPPGSVFKISSALAGLESGKINRETEIEDVGEFELGGLKFGNWFYLTYGSRDGVLKIDRAIARSNDIFFYKLGEKVGLADLRSQALRLGFSQKTGIDLPGEAYGLVGDEVWKRANLGDNWFLGDTMHMAIGQGYVLTTPIQINRVTDFMANGGKLVRPYLVTRVKPQSGKELDVQPSIADGIVGHENLQIVRDGMRQACEKSGTAWPFFDAKYKVGCKTGTAEKTQGDPHAWFTAFAPYDNPKIAITVIIENGGEGSSVAAPVAREILDWYFARKQ